MCFSCSHYWGESEGVTKTGVRKELCYWLKTGHKLPANPKTYREDVVFNAEIVVSLRRKRISNVSVLLHCFVATEQMRKIKLAVITTTSCLIKLKLRECLCKIEF